MESQNTTTVAAEVVSTQPVAAPAEVSTPNLGAGILNPSANPMEHNNPIPETSWLDKLPEDLRKSASLSRFKDEASLAQGYENLRQLVGKKIQEVPGEELTKHFTPEDLASFQAAKGVPETSQAYDLPELPQYLTANPTVAQGLNEAREIAHKHGVSNELFKEFVKLEVDLHQKAQNDRLAANFAELTNTYGANLEQANTIATNAAYHLGGDQAVQALAASGLAANPLVFNMLFKAGQMMKQDVVPIAGAQGVGRVDHAQSIQQEINNFRTNPDKYNKWKQNDPGAQAELRDLYTRLQQVNSGR